MLIARPNKLRLRTLNAENAMQRKRIRAVKADSAPRIALVDPSSRTTVVDLQSGRAVTVEEEGGADRLMVRSPNGALELSVRFTADGPVLSFAGGEVGIESKGLMRLDCGRFELRAREGIELVTEGDLRERIAGKKQVNVGASAEIEAHSVQVTSRRGDVNLKANDDVCLNGERVLLND